MLACMTAEEPPGHAPLELPDALRGGVRPPERIERDGMLVRRFVPGDLNALHAAVAASYEHLRPWMAWSAEPPKLPEQAEFLARCEAGWAFGLNFNYGVFDPSGDLAATVGIHARVGPHALEIGYWAHVAHTGRGYVTRASAALTREVFALPGVEHAEIHCDEANTASAAVPARLGYRLDRIEDRAKESPGESGRGMVWIMDRDAFPGSAADATDRAGRAGQD
jgi:RimJ/RimL family protein N-acetyltransferase